MCWWSLGCLDDVRIHFWWSLGGSLTQFLGSLQNHQKRTEVETVCFSSNPPRIIRVRRKGILKKCLKHEKVGFFTPLGPRFCASWVQSGTWKSSLKGKIFHPPFLGFKMLVFGECRMSEEFRICNVWNNLKKSWPYLWVIILLKGSYTILVRLLKRTKIDRVSIIMDTAQSIVKGGLVAAWKRTFLGSNPMITNRQSSIGEAKYKSKSTCKYIHTITN